MAHKLIFFLFLWQYCRSAIFIANVTEGEVFNCPDSEQCIIVCGSDGFFLGHCSSDTVNCPSDDSLCVVNCNGESACYELTVNWNDNGQLNLDGDYAGWGLEFPKPQSNAPTTIICDSFRECSAATIYCPSDADCDVQCSSQGSCDLGAIVYCPENGDCNIDCSFVSCGLIQINCPTNGDCSISCTNPYACLYATINCPINGNCDIFCDGYQSCFDFQSITWSTPPYRNNLNCTTINDTSGACQSSFTVPPTQSPTPFSICFYTSPQSIFFLTHHIFSGHLHILKLMNLHKNQVWSQLVIQH